MKTKTLNVSYNCFGDTVLSFSWEDKQYHMFQYGCRAAKDLLERVVALVAEGYDVFVVEDDMSFVNVIPAIKYIQDIIQLDEDAYQATMHSPFVNNCAGAEIAGHYGY